MEYWQPLDVRDYNPIGVQEWKFDWSAIEQVTAEFGITRFCLIVAGITRFAGHYEPLFLSDGDYYHKVTVAGNTKCEAASRILWHEMTHVKQVEELGIHEHRFQYSKEYYAADIAFSRAHGYFRNEKEARAYQQTSFEREAYEASTLRHDDLPLTKMRA